MKQLPGAIVDPIAVFDSPSGHLAFMLDLHDANNVPILAYIEFEADRNHAKANIIRSVFAKKNEGKPNLKWFTREYQKNLRFINTDKKRHWNATAGANSLWGKTSNANKQKIFTQDDLIKLKEQYNNGFYEEIAESRPGMESDSAMNLPGIGEELRQKYAEAIEKARAKAEAILAKKRLV